MTPIRSAPDLLRFATRPAWVDAVRADFDRFLIDHAACERKASAMAVSMICHYPDRARLVQTMADLALEEMAHYRDVIRLLSARQVAPRGDEKDSYVNGLRGAMRTPRETYFQDRLLVAGVIEARGAERFGLLAASLDDRAIRDFYARLAQSEARHHELFFTLADEYFDADDNAGRLGELLDIEAGIVADLPPRAALH